MRSKQGIRLGGLLVILLTLTIGVAAQSRLDAGKKLKVGSVLTNKNGVLFMRYCGNLMLYDKNHTVLWESGTYVDYGQQVRYLRMSQRGDLEVIVTAENVRKPQPLWSSSTSEKYGAAAIGAHLEVDWEHHLLKIISKGGSVLWCSAQAEPERH